MMADLFILPYSFVHFFFIYLEYLFLVAYKFGMVLSSCKLKLLNLLYQLEILLALSFFFFFFNLIPIAIPAYFWFTWHIFQIFLSFLCPYVLSEFLQINLTYLINKSLKLINIFIFPLNNTKLQTPIRIFIIFFSESSIFPNLPSYFCQSFVFSHVFNSLFYLFKYIKHSFLFYV